MSLQRTRLLFATVAMSSLLTACGGGGGGAGSPAPTPAPPPPAVALCTPTTTNPAPAANAPQVTMTLSNGGAVSGDVVLTLDSARAPVTVANFLAYVNAGFYDGTVFHRHAPGFVLQGGGYAGPLTAGGTLPTLKTTNAAITLEDNTGLSNLCLSVAMARTSVADSATSQFFINLTNNTFLDRTATTRGYAVFGSVTSGNAVLTAAINANCTAWTALLPVGDCLPSPNVTITRAPDALRPGPPGDERAAATMCQLLGMNANTPTDVMFSFTGLATRADEHKDGFGIAFFEDRGLRHFIDRDGAIGSPVAQMIKRYPIQSDVVIAHIRKATVGSVALQNCHPFVRELWGRYWVFAHNGDLKDYQPRLHGHFRPVGDTDSERAFCWLMQELAKAHASVPTVDELSCTLRELLPQPARHGTFNVLLSNGQALWAHGTTKLWSVERAHPFTAATLADEDLSIDFAAHTTPQDRVAVVATEPLTRNEAWVPFAPGELRVFVGGRQHRA